VAGLIPHLAIPFRIEAAGAAVVDDGLIDEIAQNVRVIVASRRGERLAMPTFGSRSPVFDPITRIPDRAAIGALVRRWEPRADIEFITQDVTGDGTVDTTIRVAQKRRT
jgi:phage baseplate assembly protein W